MNQEEILVETSMGAGSGKTQLESLATRDLIASLQRVVDVMQALDTSSANGWVLDEVSVTLKVLSQGQLVVAGAGDAGGGGIVLRLRRSDRIAPAPVAVAPAPKGVDCSTLDRLLAAGKWKDANQETWDLLCQAVGKGRGSYLSPADLARIPCHDLTAIDRLWQQHSQGRFGFSVQKQAYDLST